MSQITIQRKPPFRVAPVYLQQEDVQADIPAVLGMQVLDSESLIADTVVNRLTKRERLQYKEGTIGYFGEWSMLIVRPKSNHVFTQTCFLPKIYSTRAQLWKLHWQFFDPSAQKLFNHLRRARPEEATPETLNTLRNLSKRCDLCERIKNAPTRFRISFGAETVRSNAIVLLDVIYIDGKPVLHIVDEVTHLSTAQLHPDVSTKTIRKTILQCWATTYTGLTNRMLVDQGSAFGPLFINTGVVSNVGVDCEILMLGDYSL